MAPADLAAGRIEPVLLDWSLLPEYRVFAVYPHRRFLSPKVRVFLHALTSAFGDGSADRWWPADLAPGREKSAARAVPTAGRRRAVAS